MDEKDLGELRELVAFLKDNGIAQFEMERADLKVKLKFAGAATETAGSPGAHDLAYLAQMVSAGHAAPASGSSPTGPAIAAPAISVSAGPAQEPAPADPGWHTVKSPLVGTFYAAPAPGAEPFVKVGDRVSVGQVLCIVEAMKLMNEVEADASGEIVKVLVSSDQPVEYGQALFAIR